MTWRTRKQLVGVSIVGILLCAVLGYVLFQWFDQEPTCFDGKQNGDETGVDCGGSCEKVCKGEARDLLVQWSRAFNVTQDVYNVVAYLENRNPQSGIREIPYEFELYDTNNIIVAERSGTTFIGPNRRTAIVEASITTGNRKPQQTFFNIPSNPEWSKTSERFSQRVLVVESQQLENTDTRPRLQVKLRNTTLNPVYDIKVIAIVYDTKGNAMQVSSTTVDTISGSQTISTFFTWPQPFTRNVSRVEVIPRINVFSPRN